MPLVYIIIVNYNGYKDTIDCVNSLRKIKYDNYKIVIIDNDSTNDSVKKLKFYLEDCTILSMKSNLGFAGGNNFGINYALKNNAEFVLLLNNDTIVKDDFLNNMILTFIKETNAGIVGCKIMYHKEKNRIWYGGGKIDWFKFIGIHFGMKEFDNGQCDFEKEIDFMTGCCMLIKKDVFKKVGMLPEEYFMYFEDLDFCVRVKDFGYKILYNPKSVIYHKVGLSSGGEESQFSVEWGTRNRIVFMNKYKKKVKNCRFISSQIFFYITRILKCIKYICNGKIYLAKAILKGIEDSK
ncbi:glycosyltransferase family 2 protein [Clostridium neuense]|uniref:Glycosyltransferase family 2 protein n=1 Tax=Clostridium neuense TaxID=1728934 RepID=A0ABW8T9E4_9CLOT